MGDTSDMSMSEWFENLIGYARNNETRLTTPNFGPPCQIEVFWIESPIEGQLYAVTHDQDRPDEQIFVNGPYIATNFINQVEQVRELERWKKSISSSKRTSREDNPASADKLTEEVGKFIQKLKDSVFKETSAQPFFLGGSYFPGSINFQAYVGDVTNINIEEDLSGYFQPTDEVGNPDSDGVVTIPPEIEVIGGYIHEPIWVDEPPELSFKDKILGSSKYIAEDVIESTICETDVYIRKDGLILLNNHQKKKVRDILNTVLGVGIFDGFRRWRTILDRDMVSGGVTNGRITSWGTSKSTSAKQNPSLLPDDSEERDALPLENLNRLIRMANLLYPIHDVREMLILHLQAHTHLLDEEFSASFVLNWTVVEQLLERQLKREIKSDYAIDWDAEELEFAAITDMITHSEYELLDGCKSKRNEIVHEMKSVSVLKAEKFDILTSKLLVEEINNYLQSQGVDSIDFSPKPVKYQNQGMISDFGDV